ncbi:glyoxalase [Vibrio sp. T187]|uniref:VOC family protein n=1 Tax=Vibrio TaxID=662 RepID=UPI0010C9652C|nr:MULTISPECIES: VOC family protein [Vibrio]MBW3695180.1 glyoxalase [Vibrio sp. T187]
MKNLQPVEIKSFVPAKDFAVSKQFYQAIGFEMASEFGAVAYFKKGDCAFLLQDFYEPQHSENFMMHLLVEDAQSWYQHIQESLTETEFEYALTDLVAQPWGMLEFCLTDPSGVLWRIAENT